VLELDLRFARGEVFRAIELREVLPDDLVRGVLLEPLRAAIPADDPAVRIEHEDGVISDALDQQTEAVVEIGGF
jgi:hypothetical protein